MAQAQGAVDRHHLFEAGVVNAAMSDSDTLAETPALAEKLEALGREVRKSCRCTVSTFQIAALLESAGITDFSAQQRYGHADIFALAQTVSLQTSNDCSSNSVSAAASFPGESLRDTLLDYLRGPLALLPMVLLSLIMALYKGIGRWGSEEVLATSMAMVCSLLATSGFVQAVSRKGASYLSQGCIRAGRRSIVLIVGAGLLVVIGSAALFVAFALSTAWLPLEEVSLIAVTFIALSCLWLVSGVLFLLKQTHWYGIGLAIGVGLSSGILWAGGRAGLSAGVVMLGATVVGLAAALMVMGLAARNALTRQATVSPASQKRVILAPPSQLIVSLAPYFVYGVLYVVFILSGHIAGWLGRVPHGMERMSAVAIIELGLTLALGGNILASGVAERTMRRFWLRVRSYQLQTAQGQPEVFNWSVQDFAARERLQFVLALVLCSAATLAGLGVVLGVVGRANVAPWLLTPQMATVLGLGMVGYGLMAVGTFDCMFMITLSRPRQALEALGMGILITLGVGIAISQFTSYQYSAIGVALGGFMFYTIAHAWTKKMLARADYYYYSSF